MADGDKALQPIIKKIKKGGHGHHGGAWKVAYADFVTAMMAFFLLMWLLNATEAETLAGLAEYFAPTVGLKDEMGIGFRGGKGIIEKGIGTSKDTNSAIIFGAPAGTVVKNPVKQEDLEDPDVEKVQIAQDNEQIRSMEKVQEEMRAQMNRTPDMVGLEDNLSLKQISEGLEIQMVNKDKKPMFAHGSAKIEPGAEKVLENVAELVGNIPNHIAIIGHTSTKPLSGSADYTIWELSAARASATRRFLIEHGVLKEQVSKLIARADQEPFDPQSPESNMNDRVSIIILRQAIDAFHNKSSPDAIFVDPKAAGKESLQNVVPKADKPAAPVIKKKPTISTDPDGWNKSKAGKKTAPENKLDNTPNAIPPAMDEKQPAPESPIPSMGL
ncbi:MAG: hypothetical protein EB060_07960 [Proteobacteria bacterium]|nr:hypothetical protein [Pseudomonadota bacterium]